MNRDEEDAGEQVPRCRTDGQGAADPDLAVALDGNPQLVAVGVDLFIGQVQRRLEQELLEILPGLNRLVLEAGKPGADLPDNQVHQPGDDADQSEFGNRDGQPLRPAVASQELHKRHQQGRDQQ